MFVTYRGKKFKVKSVKGSGLHLNLRKKKVDDISQIMGLDELTDLVFLDLSENQITEITGLSNLKNLRELSLSYNRITEIKGLENLVNLKILRLERNQINEISGLENLVNLGHLGLSNNNITELKGLENLLNLNSLYLFHNPVFDWIKVELGSFRLAKTAVKFCSRKSGKELFNLEEVEQFLNLKKEEISTLVQEKEYFKVMKILKEVFNEVKIDNSTLFYKFFGEFLWKFPQLFEKKKFVNEYMQELRYVFSEKQGFQMETYVINNYCTYQDEEVLRSFYGKIYSHKMIYEGRIHITNYRIFLFGSKEEVAQGGPSFFRVTGIFTAIISFTEASIRTAIRSSIKKQGKQMMSKYGNSEEIPSFGYQFPIVNIVKKEVNKGFLAIRCNIGGNSFEMNLIPTQLKDESENELSERIKHISSILQFEM